MDLFYKENNVGSSPIAATILLQVFPEGNKFKSFTEYQICCGVSEVWLSGWPHKPMPSCLMGSNPISATTFSGALSECLCNRLQPYLAWLKSKMPLQYSILLDEL